VQVKTRKLPEVSGSEVLRGFGGWYYSGTHGDVDKCCERQLGGYSLGTHWVLTGYSVGTQWVLSGYSVGTQWVLLN
jgi:hypothetical protein